MKTSLLLSVAAAALTLAATQASAGGYKPYVSLFGGGAWLNNNPDVFTGFNHFEFLANNPGYIIGGAVGADWGNQLRTELELSHAHWNADKVHEYNSKGADSVDGLAQGNISATYLLGNVWLDLTHGSQFTPYVGGGIGMGWANVNAFTNSMSATPFDASGLAFQLGAGVRYSLGDHVSIDAGYRFKDIVGLNYTNPNPLVLSNTSLASHNFQIGLTYDF